MSHTCHLVQKEIKYYIRKLINTNGYTKEIFLLVDCGEFFRLNMSLQYSIDNVLRWNYSGKIRNEKNTKKYNNILFLHINFSTDLNSSVNPLKTLSIIYKGLSLI